MGRSIPIVVLCLVLMWCGSVARAEPLAETHPRHTKKTLLRAYLATVATTTLPMALAAAGGEGNDARAAVFGSIGIAGAVLGPSGGHWYTGKLLTPGLTMRVGSVAAIGALALHDPHLSRPTTVMGLFASVALWETGVIWDLVTLPRAVRRHNDQRQLQLVPVTTGRGPVLGLGLAGTL